MTTAAATGERFLIRLVGGPSEGDVLTPPGADWPLQETIRVPFKEDHGLYRKVSESQLPPQGPESHNIRGAQYEWETRHGCE